MIEATMDITTADGAMETFICAGEGENKGGVAGSRGSRD